MLTVNNQHNSTADTQDHAIQTVKLSLFLSIGIFLVYVLMMMLVILGVVILAGVPMGYVAVKFVPALLITLTVVISGMGLVCRACYSALHRRQSDTNTPQPGKAINR